VTKRLRLEPEAKLQYQQQWSRRLVSERHAVAEARLASGYDEMDKKSQGAGENEYIRSLAQELASAKDGANSAAFAYGGLHPGTLHSHGLLPELHKVFYSVGIAGQYLLHVRLRKQAVALPGSPFFLTIKPGAPHALNIKLPAGGLSGEVGGRCSLLLATADKVGNTCVEGGGKLQCLCTSTPLKGDVDTSPVECVVTDNGDGTYKIVWNASITGTFKTSVTVDGRHVVNSPAKIRFFSMLPDLTKTLSKGDGLLQVVKNEMGTFRITLRDEYGNPTAKSDAVQDIFNVGMCLAKSDVPASEVLKKGMRDDFDGEWIADEGGDPAYWHYQVSYRASDSGNYALHVWMEEGSLGPNGERANLPGSPFTVSVRANANDQVTHEVVDVSGIESGDYKFDKAAYEEAQAKWGAFSIDAFASAATTMTSRFWAASQKSIKENSENSGGAEAVDAFQQEWRYGERIWAHPPAATGTTHLDELAKLLMRSDRGAEVVVCAPYRPTTDWYYRILKLSDEQIKYRSGKLQQVAHDAPKRVSEWPTITFHIPAPSKPPPGQELARASRASHDSTDSQALPGKRMVRASREAWPITGNSGALAE